MYKSLMTILMATIWYSLILIIYTYWLYPIAGSGLDRLQHQGAASHCPCSCLDGSLHLSRAPGLKQTALLGMYGMEWKHAQPFKVLSGGCGVGEERHRRNWPSGNLRRSQEQIGRWLRNAASKNRWYGYIHLFSFSHPQHEAWSYPNLQNHSFQTYHGESPIAGPFSQ